MTRHYSDEGRLVALECDECGALIAPNPEISKSGWTTCGVIYPNGDKFTWEYCSVHTDIAERIGSQHMVEWTRWKDAAARMPTTKKAGT